MQPEIVNLGVSGDTTAGVLNRLANEVRARNLDDKDLAIIFSVGANNAMLEAGKPRSTPKQYKTELEAIFKNASEFSNKLMFVGLTPCDENRTMPVAWGDFTYTNERLWLMEQTMREVAAIYSIPHVAIFESFQNKQKEQDLFADGLHPNNTGHELIADIVLPELDKLLKP